MSDNDIATAINGIQEQIRKKIAWHDEQIAEHQREKAKLQTAWGLVKTEAGTRTANGTIVGFILDLVRQKNEVTTAEIKQALRDHNLTNSTSTVGTTLSRLVNRGRLINCERGIYKLGRKA